MPELDVGAVTVKAARKEAGLTQAHLAQRVGVSRQTVISIERGDYAPSVYLALRIARELRTSVERLFPLD
ncbi:helix-turn-helix transcriptional regulator [Brevibacterium litoralis]|uniref:helix-turn-helix transcriptional regulator n=1 Tax=Brevibacterium litoralis TaxID=3138935 RepID=UPI0032EABDAA